MNCKRPVYLLMFLLFMTAVCMVPVSADNYVIFQIDDAYFMHTQVIILGEDTNSKGPGDVPKIIRYEMVNKNGKTYQFDLPKHIDKWRIEYYSTWWPFATPKPAASYDLKLSDHGDCDKIVLGLHNPGSVRLYIYDNGKLMKRVKMKNDVK